MEWITTDDIKKETWRRLLEFANDDFAIACIEHRHGKINKANESNYKKQARQIRLCLLQAKEYLESSDNASIITSPNLLYYSAISLCSATMLLNGDGSKSLDFLRKHRRGKSHGLSRSIKDENNIAKGTNLLDSVELKVSDQGFLKEWYETLPENEPHHTTFERVHNDNTITTNLSVSGKTEFSEFSQIKGKTIKLIDLLKRIPDLAPDLNRLGINSNTSRISEKVTQKQSKVNRQWIIHRCSTEEDLNLIVSRFKINNSDQDITFSKKISGDSLSAIVSISYDENNVIEYSWPDIRWTNDGNRYCYPASNGVMEIVEVFGILYLTGMICRYYPDLWIESIDKHSISAKIIENSIETIKKKLPILALQLMSNDRIIISSRVAPWLAH